MKKLYRSRTDRKIAGICGGLGEVLDIDPTFVRLVVVFTTVATGIVPGVITYVAAWWLIPEGPEPTGQAGTQPPNAPQP